MEKTLYIDKRDVLNKEPLSMLLLAYKLAPNETIETFESIGYPIKSMQDFKTIADAIRSRTDIYSGVYNPYTNKRLKFDGREIIESIEIKNSVLRKKLKDGSIKIV